MKYSVKIISKQLAGFVSALAMFSAVLTGVTGGIAQAAGYVYGTTWYSDGTRSKSGPVGTAVSAYAVGAVPNIPYRLVSGQKGCSTNIVPINTSIVYAGSNGIIGRVTGTMERAVGTYDVCFYRVTPGAEGSLITSPVSFTVTPIVAGTTWYSDGTRSKSGPSGTTVSAYAAGAIPNVAYKLVSGQNGCTTNIQDVNSAVVTPGHTGIIGKVTGTINRPAGTYDICFYSVSSGSPGTAITAPVTFVITQ